MVNWPTIKSIRPITYGIICATCFLIYYFFTLTNAIIKSNNEPQLVLVFLGYPTTLLLFSLFTPALEWIGKFGVTLKTISEWFLLGCAGIIQYFLFGFIVSNFFIQKDNKND
jgi:hypothetical protein